MKELLPREEFEDSLHRVGNPEPAADTRHILPEKSFYKWKRRRAEHGDAGLCDRPRTPRRSFGISHNVLPER